MKRREERIKVITDIDDCVKSSGGLKICGIALGGIDKQYNRGQFYPGNNLLSNFFYSSLVVYYFIIVKVYFNYLLNCLEVIYFVEIITITIITYFLMLIFN